MREVWCRSEKSIPRQLNKTTCNVRFYGGGNNIWPNVEMDDAAPLPPTVHQVNPNILETGPAILRWWRHFEPVSAVVVGDGTAVSRSRLYTRLTDRSHPLIWRGQGLWHILQLATKGWSGHFCLVDMSFTFTWVFRKKTDAPCALTASSRVVWTYICIYIWTYSQLLLTP